jgi:prepilin-type N-terminal cleavage/methylation domain-containing protein
MSDVFSSLPSRSDPLALRRRAFSLVELLVVIGIIALIAGGFGLALNDSGGNALASGQTTLAALVNTARAQAAVNQTNARVLIYGARPPAGDAEKFLRLLQVVREILPIGSNRWEPVGPPVSLPQGVYLVPTSTSGLLAAGVVWPTSPVLTSTLSGPVGHGQPQTAPMGNNAAYYLQFGPDGTVVSPPLVGTAYWRLTVSTAALASNVPAFNNSGAVRGVLIRPSGSVTFVNEATSF